MTPRAARIAAFLEAAGWGAAMRAPLAGDASQRRYERLRDETRGTRSILMDAPPEKGEDTRPFVAIARHLSALGLSAPEILAEDNSVGLLLLEDLGDDLFARMLAARRVNETDAYAAAVDVLVALHSHAPPVELTAYTPGLMAEKAALAGQWYAGGSAPVADTETDQPAARAIVEGIAPLLAQHADDARVLILRDYHAENLLWLPDRPGIARVGLLDFQDALAGHPAYDLVSLLEDARRDVPKALQSEMVARYIAATGADPATFALSYALLGAQRNLRILGVFARLSLVHGKPHYADLIPRVWGHLQRDLAHPDLAEFAETLRAVLPPPDAVRLQRLKARCATVPTP